LARLGNGRTKGNDLKLKEGRFRLDIRERGTDNVSRKEF